MLEKIEFIFEGFFQDLAARKNSTFAIYGKNTAYFIYYVVPWERVRKIRESYILQKISPVSFPAHLAIPLCPTESAYLDL